MKKNYVKRMVAFMLALVLVVTLVPTASVFAAQQEVYEACKEGGTPIWSSATSNSTKVRVENKGALLYVVSSKINKYGNLWLKLADGNWVFSQNVAKHVCTGFRSMAVGNTYVDRGDGTHNNTTTIEEYCRCSKKINVRGENKVQAHTFTFKDGKYICICRATAPHEHDFVYSYATQHPHEKTALCTTCGYKEKDLYERGKMKDCLTCMAQYGPNTVGTACACTDTIHGELLDEYYEHVDMEYHELVRKWSLVCKQCGETAHSSKSIYTERTEEYHQFIEMDNGNYYCSLCGFDVTAEKVYNYIQAGLSVCGFFTGACDVAQLIVAVEHKDTSEIWWSALAIFPFLGIVPGVTKLLKTGGNIKDLAKTADTIDDIKDISKVTETIDNIKDAGNLIDEVSDSKKLGEALIANGYAKPTEYTSAAHHIVAGNHPSAEVSRQILKKHGVSINDWHNGVWLPTQADAVTDALYHPSLHNGTYFQRVEELLTHCDDKEEVYEMLGYIRDCLLNGKLP